MFLTSDSADILALFQELHPQVIDFFPIFSCFFRVFLLKNDLKEAYRTKLRFTPQVWPFWSQIDNYSQKVCFLGLPIFSFFFTKYTEFGGVFSVRNVLEEACGDAFLFSRSNLGLSDTHLNLFYFIPSSLAAG